ncbi:MAG: hypothetical protein NTZ78_10250 [Candidatus Aureabacteria bacterium]|nr:hypothetical protein [Candidatus Auribacterota bacterium]
MPKKCNWRENKPLSTHGKDEATMRKVVAYAVRFWIMMLLIGIAVFTF